jgi:hypothetical protein
MKQIILYFLFVSSLTFICHVSVAQEQEQNRLGIGMSIEPDLFGSSLIYTTTAFGPDGYYLLNQPAYQTSPINFYFPINVTPSFRLEPAFGLYTFRDEETAMQKTTFKYESNLVHLGFGMFYVIPTTTRLQMYIGPRFGINFLTTVFSLPQYNPNLTQVERETNETDVVVGMNFGAEYYAAPEFSIGGEMDLNYVFYGNPNESYTPPSSSTSTTVRSQHVLSTSALFFLRWYFVQKSTGSQ